ncbi:ESCRT-II subunit protein [Saccharomycopsis crataegensis]|uniref:ESCRT-II subunit protein n=1 Tax=Saccharomycopsis crataegensis TaxID=43959 RepID=A0AAV5QLC4_9ASCO|nr:ESCRT-II subunit protein [Saccharomycopsis crataegensis]
MSKKIGLSSFTNSESALKQYQQLGKSLADQQHEKLSIQLSVFQQALANFAKNHPEEIKSNENLRKEFTSLCFSVGVDPLAASLSKKSASKNKNASLWSKLLGDDNDEFYNELAVKIIELCKKLEDVNGGIVAVDELLKIMTNPDSPNSIVDLTESDIEKSVELLSTLDPNFKVITVGDQNKKFIRSVSKELNNYETKVFEICEIMGYATVGILVDNYRWSSYHSKDVLEEMVSFGFLWVDVDPVYGEVHYWDPSWINKLERGT